MKQRDALCPLATCTSADIFVRCNPRACMWAVEYGSGMACALAVMAAEQDPQRIGVKTIDDEEDSDA